MLPCRSQGQPAEGRCGVARQEGGGSERPVASAAPLHTLAVLRVGWPVSVDPRVRATGEPKADARPAGEQVYEGGLE